jgi:hypothetical protein
VVEVKFNLFGLFGGKDMSGSNDEVKPVGRVWVNADKWTAIQDETSEEVRQSQARARLGVAFYEANPDMSKHDRLDATYAIVEAGCDTDEAIQMIKKGVSANEIVQALKKNEIGNDGVGRSPSP